MSLIPTLKLFSISIVTPFLLPVDPVVLVRSAALTITSTLMLTLKISMIK
jgi:hypothetical protein